MEAIDEAFCRFFPGRVVRDDEDVFMVELRKTEKESPGLRLLWNHRRHVDYSRPPRCELMLVDDVAMQHVISHTVYLVCKTRGQLRDLLRGLTGKDGGA